MKIIIVEDEAAIREGMEGILKKLSPSYEVIGKAENGREGLSLIRSLRPDVILLDIRMPDMDGLSMLGELLYEGKGVRRSAVQARRMWKKAAEAGDVLAMIALGDDCMASGKGPGAALRYYRQAQTAARPTPDIAYMPQVRLRMAQYETQYLSRPRALAEMAEAKQGFKIQLGEGDPAAEQWLQETEDAIRRLLGDEKR